MRAPLASSAPGAVLWITFSHSCVSSLSVACFRCFTIAKKHDMATTSNYLDRFWWIYVHGFRRRKSLQTLFNRFYCDYTRTQYNDPHSANNHRIVTTHEKDPLFDGATPAAWRPARTAAVTAVAPREQAISASRRRRRRATSSASAACTRNEPRSTPPYGIVTSPSVAFTTTTPTQKTSLCRGRRRWSAASA